MQMIFGCELFLELAPHMRQMLFLLMSVICLAAPEARPKETRLRLAAQGTLALTASTATAC